MDARRRNGAAIMDDESRYRYRRLYELILLAMAAGMLLISVVMVAQVCATPGPRFYETSEPSPAARATRATRVTRVMLPDGNRAPLPDRKWVAPAQILRSCCG